MKTDNLPVLDHGQLSEALRSARTALTELAHFRTPSGDCWCSGREPHSPGCHAARAAVARINAALVK